MEKYFKMTLSSPQRHILGDYVMAPSLEAMYHDPHFLFMCWPPSLYVPQLLFSNVIGLPSCTRTLLATKLEASKWISKSLSKLVNFNISVFTKMFSRFQRPHYMLHPIHKFQMTSSKGLSKVWLSLQSFL